jgi:hypothetical protein
LPPDVPTGAWIVPPSTISELFWKTDFMSNDGYQGRHPR